MKNRGMCASFVMRLSLLCGLVFLLTTGCKKRADYAPNFTIAINSYYNAHPACLWTTPMKLPAQVAASDSAMIADFNPLVDEGLLVRTAPEKSAKRATRREAAVNEVSSYSLSDKGRAAWTADAQQPRYGNFCYGHRKVKSIDGWTPTDGGVGSTSVVNYHYTVEEAPAWATSLGMQTAYPQLHADLTGPQQDQATLTRTNEGWQVTSVRKMGNPDGGD